MEQLGRWLPQMEDVRGQDNYTCLDSWPRTTVKYGHCHAGEFCLLRENGCLFYDQVRKAQNAQIVVTNYAFWMAANAYMTGWARGPALGFFDLLICDEADVIFNALSDFVAVELNREWCEHRLDLPFPDKGLDIEGLKAWAGKVLKLATEKKARLEAVVKNTGIPKSSKPAIMIRQITWLGEAIQGLGRFTTLDGKWVARWADHAEAVSILPVWPSNFAEQYLWCKTDNVVLMSGTLTEKTMGTLKLGERGKEWELLELPSTIPASQRQVIHLATCAMSTGRADMVKWCSRIDQIVASRADRKILVHTTSYYRSREYAERTRFKDRIIVHGPKDTEAAVTIFSARNPPVALVSPSLARGFDFPNASARCAVIGKVPFPDGRDPLVKARQQEDSEYSAHETMIAFQQMCGRTIRGENDWSEVLVVDDDIRWFWRKYRHLASAYFQEAVEYGTGRGRIRTVELIPDPLEEMPVRY